MSTAHHRRPPSTIGLGPFDLVRPVAKGSTAIVWRGVHRGSGAPVAIKVLTHARWRNEARGGPLELEVRTLARLNHPAVVAVHDYGWLTPREEAASQGALIAGCPYVVMDWHGGGTLRGFAPADFATVRAIMLRLLDALAHVHARGLIHRDLKPANVLIGRDGVILTDLGLAYSLTETQSAELKISGTPNYISPEQAALQPWHYGPWTDLYALGCVGWALTTGRAPYHRDTPRNTLYARLRDALPAFAPRVEVPDGFAAWLRQLLARAPADRFRCAAHAARALSDLGGPAPSRGLTAGPTWVPDVADDATISDVTHATGSDPVLPGVEPTLQGVLSTTWSMPALDLSALTGNSRRPSAEETPSFLDWRLTESGPRASFTDCGRGLTRLRQPTMCGRVEERDRLWEALSRTASEGAMRVAIVDGAPGVGKTRLIEWLCTRAHELGLAETIRVGAALQSFQASRLWTMFARRVDHRGVSPVELFKHLTESIGLDEGVARVITDLSAPDATGPNGKRSTANEREGFRGTLQAIGLLADRGPVVIAVDDAHRDEVILRFVNYTVRRRPDLPVLFVLSLDRSDARIGAGLARTFDALATRFGAPILLGPLATRTAAEIAAQRLPLEPGALDALCAASRGNPLHTSVVLQHWLDRGALTASPTGHALREDVGPLPDGVVAAWSQRLDHLLSGLPEGGDHALEIAAALGSPFARPTWFAVCEAAGVTVPDAVLFALIDMDVITIGSRDRLALGHPILAQALAGRARRGGRWRRWHGLCADLLLASGQTSSGEVRRIAHHLARAGRHAEAMPWLLESLEAARRRGNRSARRDRQRDAMRSSRAMRARRSSVAWVRIKEEWSRSLRGRSPVNALRHGRQCAALALALDASAESADTVAPADLADAGVAPPRRAPGTPSSSRLGLDDLRSAPPYLHVRRSHLDGRHATLIVRALQAQAHAALLCGRLDEADAALTQGERRLRGVDAPRLVAINDALRCDVASRRGDLERAWRFSHRALTIAREHGYRGVLAGVLNARGELARWRGDLSEAESAYRESEQLATMEEGRALAMNNLSLVYFERGDFEAARREAERARWTANRLHDPMISAIVAICMLAAVAPSDDREAWDRAWQAMKPVRDLRHYEFDLARTIDLAARAAWPHMPRRALEAAHVALEIYRAVGSASEQTALEQWVAERARPS